MPWAPRVALLNMVTKAGAQAFLLCSTPWEKSLLGLPRYQVVSRRQGKEMILSVQAQKTPDSYMQQPPPLHCMISLLAVQLPAVNPGPNIVNGKFQK